MGSFDQRGQRVVKQYNADTIIEGIPLEKYQAALDKKEKKIRQLLVGSTRNERDKADLERQLAHVETLRLDERASYEAHIKDMEERIRRLDDLTGKVPEKLINEAKQALAHDHTSKADKLFRQVEQQADPHIAAAAEAAYQRGKLAEDAINYNAAFKHYQRTIQLLPDNARYLSAAGRLASNLANYEKALEWYEQALAIDLNTNGEDHPSVARDRSALGTVCWALGKYEKAIEYYMQALASDIKTYGEDNHQVARDRCNIGTAWLGLGEPQKAIKYYEQTLASSLKTYGEDHPEVGDIRNNLGGAWYTLGDPQEAIKYFEQALASDLKTFGEAHPSVARDWNNLGTAWYARGKHQKANKYFELTHAALEQVLGSDHPATKMAANNLALTKANRKTSIADKPQKRTSNR